jgi:hypothetical protein
MKTVDEINFCFGVAPELVFFAEINYYLLALTKNMHIY